MNKKEIVFTSTYQTEAYLIHSLLNSKGIKADIWDANTVSIMPLLSGVIGGVKVVVDIEDKEEALNIIDSDYSPEDFEEQDQDPDAIV